ncbi:MAG: phosphotransferase [Gammaproteobacteria bacterium]|nr:phosphotransferase [Gammaproteobacteria bacterium]
MPQRERLLREWLQAVVGLVDFSLEPASGDASFRRYFRATLPDGTTRIVMDAPPENEDCRPFVDVAGHLVELGLNVPVVYASDLERGFLLLSDLGSRHYLELLNQGEGERLYADALSALLVMQACGRKEELTEYSCELLLREMGLFREWLLGRHLELSLAEGEQQMLDEMFELLVDNALQQPQVFVHRDYHSRNLLATAPPNPGILDFQDAVMGPVTYDLVSLLKDCYISWPREQVREWVFGYYELALQSGVLRSEHEDSFLRWFDLMGVQRHLKAAGIFARLNIRDGKPGYLQDIPRTLGYIVDLVPEYPELAPLARLVSARVLPAL